MNPIVRIIRWAQTRVNAPRIAANPNPYGVHIQTDIPYRDDGDPAHLMDIYAPDAGRQRLPVIVELHGGGYVSCYKEINAQHGQYLASKGFRVVNINYTLCPEGDLSTILNELSDALDWVGGHADACGFDPDRVCLTGDSAGGHIALLAAALYTSGHLAEAFGVRVPRQRVAAYAMSCPQGSFAWRHLPWNLPARLLFLVLHRYTFDAEYANRAAYDSYMTADFPRVWFCSAPSDSLLYTHTRGMHKYMQAHGIDHVYREYQSRERKLDHVFNVLFPDYPESRAANDDMIAFFNETLKGAAP